MVHRAGKRAQVRDCGTGGVWHLLASFGIFWPRVPDTRPPSEATRPSAGVGGRTRAERADCRRETAGESEDYRRCTLDTGYVEAREVLSQVLWRLLIAASRSRRRVAPSPCALLQVLQSVCRLPNAGAMRVRSTLLAHEPRPSTLPGATARPKREGAKMDVCAHRHTMAHTAGTYIV